MSGSRRRPRLLIVEDDAALRVLLQFAAKRSEMFSAITTAADGADALEQIERAVHEGRTDLVPDVVLTDVGMPRIDGLELVARLRREPATMRAAVAVFTGEDSPALRDRAAALQCGAVYTKPAQFRELLKMMRALPALCRANAQVITGATATPFPMGRADGDSNAKLPAA